LTRPPVDGVSNENGAAMSEPEEMSAHRGSRRLPTRE